MPYNNIFPSNQKTTKDVEPKKIIPIDTKKTPVAKIQRKSIDTGAIGDGVKKVGSDIVHRELPNLLHRLIHGVVDALFPGSAPTPFVGKSNYTGAYTGYRPPVGQFGHQQFGYQQPRTQGEVFAQKKSFDKFILPDRETAMEIFRDLLAESYQNKYLTVSQVYDRLGLPCSFMGVQYCWTADDINMADITELPSGECRVVMPKAHLLSQP